MRRKKKLFQLLTMPGEIDWILNVDKLTCFLGQKSILFEEVRQNPGIIQHINHNVHYTINITGKVCKSQEETPTETDSKTKQMLQL